MSIIQISKIQVRRGLKNSGIGVPQLSSAEFAWAVDTQELFIGNGSIAEGAPYVGNTKILTEHDNILEYASSYQFGSDDPTITLSVPRSLQSKIDEIAVSVTDVGACGDGESDNSPQFENALMQLFDNPNPDYKKVLIVPNGKYIFESDLILPSNVIIKGETQNGVVLDIGSNDIRFSTSVNSTDACIENLTIESTTGQTILNRLSSSRFNRVRFVGTYRLVDTVSDVDNLVSSVFWQNVDSETKVTDLIFDNCKFENTAIAVKVDQKEALEPFDTSVIFRDCEFTVNYISVLIDSNVNLNNRWKIVDCYFDKIATHAFKSTNGRGTHIQRSKFFNCGNGNNEPSDPLTSIISFGDPVDNIVLDCTFNRHRSAYIFAENSAATGIQSFSEVENASRVDIVDVNYSRIFFSEAPRPLAFFDISNGYTQIDYFLKVGTSVRKGTLVITINQSETYAAVSDNYTFSEESNTTPEGIVMSNFEFVVSLEDNNQDSTADTIVLSYKNYLSDSSSFPDSTQLESLEGSITYSVSYGV